MIFLISAFTGCGVYDERDERPIVDITPDDDNDDDTTPDDTDDPVDDTTPFTVKIIYNEELFDETDGLEVQWASKTEVRRASFDPITNTASITGLDGDYRVTLFNLPSDYIYDANIYTASNKSRDVTIEIFKHIKTKGTGAGLYISEGCIPISRLGGYTATVKEKSKVYYEFTPNRSGTYVVDTIADINANVVNPSLDIFTGNTAYKRPSHTVDSGASEADYTRNARYQVWISPEEVGNSFTFAVSATHKNGEYPISVGFIVRFISDYQKEEIEKKDKNADAAALAKRGKITDEFVKDSVPDGRPTINYLEEYVGQITVTRTSDNGYQYDELVDIYKFEYTEGATDNPVGLNPDDGYYHLYNEATGKYDGPILYAKLSKRTRFFSDYVPPGGGPMEVSFSSFYASDPTASLSGGTENYRPFINQYLSYVSNSYGVYPVTEELKEFLQKFSESQLYFQDGEGWAETSAEVNPKSLPADSHADAEVYNPSVVYTPALGHRIYASEDAQWLFACCYYT